MSSALVSLPYSNVHSASNPLVINSTRQIVVADEHCLHYCLLCIQDGFSCETYIYLIDGKLTLTKMIRNWQIQKWIEYHSLINDNSLYNCENVFKCKHWLIYQNTMITFDAFKDVIWYSISPLSAAGFRECGPSRRDARRSSDNANVQWYSDQETPDTTITYNKRIS